MNWGEYSYIYYIILLFTLLSFISKQQNKGMFVLCALSMTILVGIRDIHCGPDTWNYCEYFKKPQSTTTYYALQGVEPGFTAITRLLNFISDNSNFYLFTMAILTLTPILYYIYKYSQNRIFSLFIFMTFGTATMIYLMSFYLMRQYMSIACLSMAIVAYKEKNECINKRTIIFILLALSMHIATMLFLPLFYKKFNFINKKNIALLFIVTFILGFFISKYLGIFQMIAILFGKGYYMNINTESGYQVMMILPLVLIGSFLVLYGKTEQLNTLEYRSLYAAIIFNNLFSAIYNSDRIVVYYLFPLMILIPNVIKEARCPKLIKFIFIFFFICYYSYKYFKVIEISTFMTIDSVVPYKSFLY